MAEEQAKRSTTTSTAKQRGKAALSGTKERQAKVSVEVEELSEDLQVSLRIRAKDGGRHEEVEERRKSGYGGEVRSHYRRKRNKSESSI